MVRTGVPLFERLFENEHRRLWGLAYRMTGSAADADDVVQDTFARALPIRPLVAAATRPTGARGCGASPSTWRATPTAAAARAPTPAPGCPPPSRPARLSLDEPAVSNPPDARYDRLESVTYAFLLALEALTPRQRAVLLLCDVFDYSVREAAAALDLGESNVKVTHHRARAAMAAYDAARCRPDAATVARTAAALEKLVAAMIGRDLSAVEALLAADACSLGDGGGRYRAGARPIVGARKVARFYHTLAHMQTVRAAAVRMVNGLPAIVMEIDPARARLGAAQRLPRRRRRRRPHRRRALDPGARQAARRPLRRATPSARRP